MNSVAICGLGVIGGSLAKALTRAGVDVRAFSPQRAERERAATDGITVLDTLNGAVSGAETVVLAVPLDRIADVARAVRDIVTRTCVILHAGSLQGLRALGLNDSDAAWLVGTHPLAGSEGTGYDSASADLFAGASVSIDETASADQKAVAEQLWKAAGTGGVVFRSRDEHDRLMAWVSHLPQLTSTALALAMSRAGIPARAGGPGLRDTTRLSASSLLMWRPILDAAAPDCIATLRDLEQAVADLRSALETGDQELLSEMWTAARAWRTNTGVRDAG